MGHGTLVAGTIAANGKIKGVGPELGLIPYKVFDTGDAEASWVVKAIIEAANDNVDVINLSLGTYKSLKNKEDRIVIREFEKAIDYAHKKGCVVVAAAGNEGLNTSKPQELAEQLGVPGDKYIYIPSSLNHVINVSASTKDSLLASYSNYGKSVDITAPGGDLGPDYKNTQQFDLSYTIISTFPTSLPQSPFAQSLGFPVGYDFGVGTSFATPKVSAIAGLIIAEYKEKRGRRPNPQQVEHILFKGTVDIGKHKDRDKFGNGLVNVIKALRYIN